MTDRLADMVAPAVPSTPAPVAEEDQPAAASRRGLQSARLGRAWHWLVRRSPAALSVRWRLTLWYTAVLAVMLGAFSLAVYWYMGTSLTRDMYRTSHDRAQQVLDIIREQEIVLVFPGSHHGDMVGVPTSQVNLDRTVDPFRDPGVGVRVFDSGGTLQAASADFLNNQDRIPTDHTALVMAIAKRLDHQEILSTSEGKFYVYTQPALSRDGRMLGAIQILTSREPYETTMDRLASLLAFGTLLAVVLAWGMGAAMAQTALEPIESITRTARQINRAQDLSRRVDVHGPKDEIGSLSGTINEMLDRVESMFSRQQQFLADVSHELRTPLTTIRGELELMERTGEIEPEALEAMQGEAERMSRLVSDLLLLARADSGLSIDRQPVRLDILMRDLHRQATTLAGAHHRVQLGRAYPVTAPGDRDRLKQLGLILIENALRHTPPGTTVRLGAYPVEPVEGPPVARLIVEDDGPGIPEEDQERVFDRLYRVDKARARASGGTGLGLSIAKWIAQAHGGSITLSRGKQGGARFVVDLPLNGGSSRVPHRLSSRADGAETHAVGRTTPARPALSGPGNA